MWCRFLLQVGACVGVLTWAFTRQGHISVSHVFHNFWLYFLRQGLLLDLEVSSSAILTALQAAESSCPYSHSHDFSAWSPQPACVTSVLKNLNSDLHDCTGPVWITESAPNPSRITFRRWKHWLAFWIPTSTLTLTWKRAINIWSYTEGSTLMFPYRKTWVKYWLPCCYPRYGAEDLSQAKTTYCSCWGPSSVLSNCEETHTIHKGSW